MEGKVGKKSGRREGIMRGQEGRSKGGMVRKKS